MFNFNFPFATWQSHCWLLDSVQNLWECCPRGLHTVISRLLAGGSLGFRIVPLLLPGSQIAVWHFRVVVGSLLFSFAIPIPEAIQCYHLFWYVSDYYELTSWSPAVLFLGCVWFVCVFVVAFCLVVLCWLCVLARWQLNGLCIDPCSVLLLMHIVNMRMLPLH